MAPETHQATQASFYRGRRPRGPRIRWGALATGSLVGIASWAALYVAGAAVAWSLPELSLAGYVVGRAVLALYGATAASFALALAAFVAATVGDSAGHPAQARLYGVCLWSLSTITLVATSLAATCGAFASLSSEAASVVGVGLAAVGLELQPQGTVSPAGVLWAMAATVALSFVFASAGARRAARATFAD